tara:strand:- start:513 stop:704 length:192 start_codon:yes stop_codon:yes gene_type:complete
MRFHSASVIGGNHPKSGRHSTIESPDSVNRVAAPINIMATTIAAQTYSQEAIGFTPVSINSSP